MTGTTLNPDRRNRRVAINRLTRATRIPQVPQGIPVVCSHCGDVLNVPLEAASRGTPVACPGCKRSTQVRAQSLGVTADQARRMLGDASPAAFHSEFPP